MVKRKLDICIVFKWNERNISGQKNGINTLNDDENNPKDIIPILFTENLLKSLKFMLMMCNNV